MSLEKKREELNKQIKINKAKINALESVVRVKKKDGTDFSTISKNFSSSNKNVTVKIASNTYSLRSNAKKLVVYGYVDGIFVDEEIDISPCIDEHRCSTIDESRIIKESFIKPYYIMTVDEIEKAVGEYIEGVKCRLDREEKALNELEELYDIFIPRAKDIMEDLKKCCGDNNTLRYDMIDLLKEVIS